MLTLFAETLWDSPFVYTVLVALEEKAVPYQVRLFDLDRGEHRAEPFRSQSITGRVPAIEHDGFVLSESVAIVEYLEERFPAPALFPKTPTEKARARQVLGWLRSDLVNLRRDRSTESMFYEHAKEPLTEAGRADAERLVRIAGLLLDGGSRATLFDGFSIADADLAFMLGRLHLNGDPLPEYLGRYVEAGFARPSARAYLERPRPALRA